MKPGKEGGGSGAQFKPSEHQMPEAELQKQTLRSSGERLTGESHQEKHLQPGQSSAAEGAGRLWLQGSPALAPGEGAPAAWMAPQGAPAWGARAGLLQAHRSLAPTPPYLEGRRA